MTSYEIKRTKFEPNSVSTLVKTDTRLKNWPVVYILTSSKEVYVGETLDYNKRMSQHLKTVEKNKLDVTHVVIHEKFNKSVCLELESILINLFTGDGKKTVLNANHGIVDADYYQRDSYREIFNEIFESLRSSYGLFSQSKPDIENSDLYKYSPFKQLNEEQENVVTSLSERIISSLSDKKSPLQEFIIQGGAGTGKTILAVYLIKLIADYSSERPITTEEDALPLTQAATKRPLRIGIVIPQSSLRQTIKRVFKSVDGLSDKMVLSPFDVPKIVLNENAKYDLLIVDEAHRLNRFSTQANGSVFKMYRDNNRALYGESDKEGDQHNQLDWMRTCSKNLVLLLDPTQAVRPADMSSKVWESVIADSITNKLYFQLHSQMRMKLSEIDKYKALIDALFGDRPIEESDVPDFSGYDFRIFTNFKEMHEALTRREEEYGLSRMVAGYAWPWISKGDKSDSAPYDFELDGVSMRWNRTVESWVHSPTAFQEVGSIHTIQGYDLNYAGVIIGADVELDESGKYRVNKNNYHDKRGKANNKVANEKTTPERLRRYVANIYKVLLTRGIRGTYIYAEPSGLAERFHQVQQILINREQAAHDKPQH
ncbi:MAG: DUF2075 domain-containing protein [Actinomyces graevenitzii]|uniref:DUF2075 domain-containing protein n=1 Tax=Actinomyces graevenitzii TaxID=55565 RepID=A0A9E7DCW1_9ACTO|nr:DUF2075 domain-containing protein [Actinomyces graevenitzii]UQF79365.1 MAG: DUF2075 domain-containing protein [Actinomyces graevenitzii]